MKEEFSSSRRSVDPETGFPPVSSAVSKVARRYFAENFSRRRRDTMSVPDPEDLEGWRAYNKMALKERESANSLLRARYGATLSEFSANGVCVVDIRPKGWMDNGQVLVYTHGGGYVGGIASDALDSTLPLASESGLRIMSVCYTLAPQARYEQVTDEAVAVIRFLLESGYTLDRIGVYGDSAGGGLAAAAVLKMRDRGIGLPGALALWSPWVDMAGVGDSYRTLEDAEPFYEYGRLLSVAAKCYVGAGDPTHPYASPLRANFTAGYPPTLIQVGTRELLLSDSVRLYQALETAGQCVKLDVYEWMWHVFQFKPIESPEAVTARHRTAAFFAKYLRAE